MLRTLLASVRATFRTRWDLTLENLALRQQLECRAHEALRSTLARAGLLDGWEHVCRRCKANGKAHSARFADPTERRCPNCGMKLWPKALPRRMNFHSLRHTTATLLKRAGVDIHIIQRILRHADIKLTADTYGHVNAEDLPEAVNKIAPLPQIAANFVSTGANRVQKISDREKAPESAETTSANSGVLMVGATGFEPATTCTPSKCATRLRHAPKTTPTVMPRAVSQRQEAPPRAASHERDRGGRGRPRKLLVP